MNDGVWTTRQSPGAGPLEGPWSEVRLLWAPGA